jgi:hypothetical protein
MENHPKRWLFAGLDFAQPPQGVRHRLGREGWQDVPLPPRLQ